MSGNLMKNIGLILVFFVGFLFSGLYINHAKSQTVKTYIGSKACGDCHEAEYKNFTSYSKKVHSFESIEKMKKGLTKEEYQGCFECHTTGYKKAGGFESVEKTPNLKSAGCEVCHGPGSAHSQSEDAADIKSSPTVEDCETCHNPERIEAFDYRPLIRGGAH
jgi:nitrate/TMAO reductase-like tetraheme cytochrome c subunit